MIGTAISTYVHRGTSEQRLQVVRRCFDSLALLSGKVIVVDDGSETKEHLRWLPSNVSVVEKPTNRGIPQAKNTGIRTLLEAGVKYVCLADDDIIFKKDAPTVYAGELERTGLGLFAFYSTDPELQRQYVGQEMPADVRVFNGYPVRVSDNMSGNFMAFTRATVDAVGYFKVFDYWYGYQDCNFIHRVRHKGLTPFYCDIVGSYELIEVPVGTDRSKDCDPGGVYHNSHSLYADLDRKEDCVE